jgi:hypothetical protein
MPLADGVKGVMAKKVYGFRLRTWGYPGSFRVNLILVMVSLVATYLGIFCVSTNLQKWLAFLFAASAIVGAYLSVENEVFGGKFGRSGELVSGKQVVTGFGHWPISLRFLVKLANEDEVIAEGLHLSPSFRADERRVRGKLIRFELLSVEPGCFVVDIRNETEQWVDIIYFVRYSTLDDWRHWVMGKLGTAGAGLTC